MSPRKPVEIIECIQACPCHSTIREGRGSELMALLCNLYGLNRKAGLKQTSCYAVYFALRVVSPLLTQGF